MLNIRKILSQNQTKPPSTIQNQAQKIVNICFACVFFLGIVLGTMHYTGSITEDDQSSPIPSTYIPQSVKIMLVDEFMEWNGFQIADYDPSRYDMSPSNTSNGSGQTPGKPQANTGSGYMDEEYLSNLQKQVSKEDKEKIFDIIYKRLTKAEIKRFVYLSKHGVTAAEKDEVKRLLSTRPTPEEIEQFRSIYSKYN